MTSIPDRPTPPDPSLTTRPTRRAAQEIHQITHRLHQAPRATPGPYPRPHPALVAIGSACGELCDALADLDCALHTATRTLPRARYRPRAPGCSGTLDPRHQSRRAEQRLGGSQTRPDETQASSTPVGVVAGIGMAGNAEGRADCQQLPTTHGPRAYGGIQSWTRRRPGYW